MTDKFKKHYLMMLLCLFIASIFLSASLAFASQGDTASVITKITPAPSILEQPKEKNRVLLDAYYEFSDIKQGSRQGSWREETNQVTYVHKNLSSYFSVSQLRRFDQRNYTANFGAYLNLTNSYLHYETGFGWDLSYIYRLQNIVEYGHKLYKGLYWQLGYNYRVYNAAGDNHIIYPGLIYYFGNHYVSTDYGAIIIEGRGTGHFGTVKGNFAITDYLHWWIGGACGNWLYDIYGLPAKNEFGYLFFNGFTLDLPKGFSARIGYSYGMENPKFFKRSIEYGLSYKF